MKPVLPRQQGKHTVNLLMGKTESSKCISSTSQKVTGLPNPAAPSAMLLPSHWPRAWAYPEYSSSSFFWNQLKTSRVQRVANQWVAKLSWLNCTILSVSGATGSHSAISDAKNWAQASQMFARYKAETEERAARAPRGTAVLSQLPQGSKAVKIRPPVGAGKVSFSLWMTG